MAENLIDSTTGFIEVVRTRQPRKSPVGEPQKSVAVGASVPIAKQKTKRAPKKPVTFTFDPAAPNTILVENLEEKDDVRYKNANGDWVARPYTDEQRMGFDRDSILYYFQCILKCSTTAKFTMERIYLKKVMPRGNPNMAVAKEDLSRRIRPLKIVFTHEKDAQTVLAAYNRNLVKAT